jgi:hypothetical protein
MDSVNDTKMVTMEYYEEREKKDRIKWLLLLLLFLLNIVLIVILFRMLLLGQSIVRINAGEGVSLQIDSDAQDYQAVNAEAFQGVAIPGWPSITIPANETTVSVDFYNPAENEGLYYLTFELRLQGENGETEVLYTSGLVEPEKHIQTITLSRALSPGTYDAVIHVQPYRMNEGRTATNNADMETKLIVE